MISVPNPRQPLNGNNISLHLLIGSFLLLSFACSSSRSIASVPSIPATDFRNQSRILVGNLDTLPVFFYPTDQLLPINSDKVAKEFPSDQIHIAKGRLTKDNILKIGFVLPFLNDNISLGGQGDINNSVSRWAIHYYTGAKLALEKWKKKGVAFESVVWDSGPDTVSLQKRVLDDNRFLDVPLIIGPYHRDNIKYLANYAKNSGVLLFSPFSAAQNLTEDNPFFYQVNPNIETQISSIVEHVNQYARAEDILIIQKDSDAKLNELFLSSFISKAKQKDVALPKVLLLSANVNSWVKNLLPELQKREKLVIIMSSYSDEVFLNNLMQELNRESFDKKEIVVYGLSPWLNLEKVDFQLLDMLNFHVSSPYFINTGNSEVREFQQKFYQELGVFPQPEAFQAFDLVNLLFENWIKKGDVFQEDLDHFEAAQFLSAPYQFKKVKTSTDDLEKWQLNRNQNVMILKFSGFGWQKD
jgi:ABC-type branched-subunit amino acid transport system substrate-binding protein